jgi:hypothetical protein
MQENVAFVFLNLAYFPYYDVLQLHPFTFKSHGFILPFVEYNSSVVGHLGCFHILAIMNCAVRNISVQCFYCILTYVSLDVWPRAVSPDRMKVLFLAF